MRMTGYWMGLFYLLLSVGCGGSGGGGSGGGGGGGVTPPPPPPDQAIGGIFNGTLTMCATCPFDVFVMISEDGVYISQDLAFEERANAGSLTVTSDSFAGSRDLYGPNPGVMAFGHPPTAPSPADADNANRGIRGLVAERQSIAGEYTHGVPSTVELRATYDPQYDQTSSLSVIAGMYSVDDGAGFSLTYVIDAMGMVSGSDSTGCTISGTVEIIDANYNMYRTDLSFSLCGATGAEGGGYTGLATLRTDPVTMVESLFFYGATDTELVILDLPRI